MASEEAEQEMGQNGTRMAMVTGRERNVPGRGGACGEARGSASLHSHFQGGKQCGLPSAAARVKEMCGGLRGARGPRMAQAPYNLPSLSAFQEPDLRHDPVLSE